MSEGFINITEVLRRLPCLALPAPFKGLVQTKPPLKTNYKPVPLFLQGALPGRGACGGGGSCGGDRAELGHGGAGRTTQALMQEQWGEMCSRLGGAQFGGAVGPPVYSRLPSSGCPLGVPPEEDER